MWNAERVRLVNVLEREGVHIRIVEAVVAEEEGRGAGAADVTAH